MLTDLREKLLKAGLVSQEQVQASAEAEKARVSQQRQSQERPPERGNGRPDGRNDGRQGQRQDRGRGDRPPGDRGPRPPRDGKQAPTDDPNAPRLSGEEVKRLVELAQKGRVESKPRGQRRWYFVSRKNGLVPFIELSDEAAQNLESGTWALCETPRGESWLVDAETAKALAAADPTWLR